ncbi:hypothetical protein [Neorhizobium sp. JUb45]|uniref:hypothetical protein n=1 Tax=unclassified Neorhizobium TaxID=2629175 RepID=UPI00104C9071|nr:hypothetical protein [Neorhizobium sp. JUb45]TCR02787.1 hypothetical protein EDF70_103212 [Neorhizobium sp. JUb45]
MTSKVKILWSEIAAGRMTVPGCYTAPARFQSDPDPADEGWSVVLEFEELDRGTARFLVDEAPHHLLRSGVTFEMYAGRSLAVTVTVL